jgi:bifunctional DNA-binding transcriptional regulator/antitoxin component of YhaV-PrlF toxin-antitoxin module
MINQQSPENIDNKAIGKIWMTGQTSPTLVIPRKFAKEYGLDKPSHVVLEKMKEGILIKKFVL